MKMKQSVLAIVAALGLFAVSLPGCGGVEEKVVQPPEQEESIVPGGELSEEEYAKQMGTQ